MIWREWASAREEWLYLVSLGALGSLGEWPVTMTTSRRGLERRESGEIVRDRDGNLFGISFTAVCACVCMCVVEKTEE